MMAEIYFDYLKMMTEINAYMNKYSFLSVNGICQSILGQTVPALVIGEGERTVIYVGGEVGNDLISPNLLLRFIKDICSLYEEGGAAFGFSAENILKNYTLVIIPMLNPDGSSYCKNGIASDNPLKERVLKMNGGSDNFSAWCKNARGVDLRYNYGAEYSSVEPEIEVGALCNFLRYGMKPDILMVFSQSENADGALYFGDGEIENKMAIALSQMSGMRREYRESQEKKLMLADWAIRELDSAAFSLEIPQENYNSRKQFEDKAFSFYAKIRKLFFCAPFLNKIK